MSLASIYSVYSQNYCKVNTPEKRDIDNGRLFRLSVKDSTLSYGDTLKRIVKVYYSREKVVSYKLSIRKDSLTSKSMIEVLDSVITDSMSYFRLLESDSLRRGSEFSLILIKSEDLNTSFPIEDIYQGMGTIRPPKLPFDTLFKKKPLVVHGSVTLIGQYSNDKYIYQTVPENYVRGYTNLNVELFGLPFSTGYGYSTESSFGPNKINNFRFSFNSAEFYQKIKMEVERKLEVKKLSHVKNYTHIDIGSVSAELKELEKKVSTRDYQNKLRKDLSIIELGEKDTIFRKSYKYKKAKANYDEHEKKFARLRELEKLKEKFEVYTRVADIDTKVAKYKLNRNKNLKKEAKRLGEVKSGQSFFLSVKKLDLGTFDPDYTVLVLSGVNLSGVNFEFNPGNLYGAISIGKAAANFNNPLNISALSSGRNIISGRVGIGSKGKLLLAMSVLKGMDNTKDQAKDSGYSVNLPSDNMVVGFDLTYKLGSKAEMGFEYAKSQNTGGGQASENLSERVSGLVDSDKNKYSSAVHSYINLNFGNTRLKTLARVVDPFYYSFGTPYLRRDNIRIEVKGEQMFWQERISTSITYRRDADNIYELKQGSSVNNTLIYGFKLRVKKYPYLILTYSPSYQSLFNSALKQQIDSRITLCNVIVGHTLQSKAVVSNSALSFIKQYSSSNQSDFHKINVNQFSLNEVITIRNLNFSINAMANYSLPVTSGDTGRAIGYTINCTKGIFKNKINVSGGGRYQKDFGIEERYIIDGGSAFNIGFGINCLINVERHFITPYTSIGQPKDMFLGRITIIKTF